MKRLLALALLAGAIHVLPTMAFAAPAPNWQQDITAADRKRLARLWEAWTRSLNEAHAAGQGAALAALGAIAVPDAAAINPEEGTVAKAAGPLPGVGAYKCRTVRLGQHEGGRKAPAAATVNTGEMLPCHIELRGNALWFEQAAGAQRLGGRLYTDGNRQVFLGATSLIGEMRIMAYSADPQRDAVGVLRAMGDRHWRLELPWPHWQSNLAIIEIVPG